jgi:MtN3 and saliva related transmembrane protein
VSDHKGDVRMKSSWVDRLSLGFLLPSVIALQGCESLGIHDTKSLLLPTFERSEVIGFVAGFGTTFAALPDLIAMLKRRSSEGMNPRMAGIMCVFQFAWVYYGLLIASRPVIVWNIVGIVTNALSVGAYLYFARKEKSRA